MKKIFDLSVEVAPKAFGPFKELLVADLDPETIWEEIQSKNRPLKRYFKAETNKLLQSVAFHSSSQEEEDDKSTDGTDPAEDGLDSEEGDASLGDGMDLDHDVNSSESEDAREEDNDEDSGSAVDAAQDNSDGVSDGEEMEAWLDEMEDLEDKHRRRIERLEQSGGRGHKGAVEVRVCVAPRGVAWALNNSFVDAIGGGRGRLCGGSDLTLRNRRCRGARRHGRRDSPRRLLRPGEEEQED